MENKDLTNELVDDKIIDAEVVKEKTIHNSEAHTKEEEDDKKYDKLWIFAEPAIFTYNTYVVFNNIMVGDGYFWVVLGIIINIVIAVNYQSVFGRVFHKINPKWSFAVIAVLFFLAMAIANGQQENLLEKSAVPVVTQIFEEEHGKGNAAECLSVEITEKLTKNLYKANAILNNGNTIRITIQDKGDQIYVSIPNQ